MPTEIGIDTLLAQAAQVIDHMSKISVESRDLPALEAAANLWMELAKFYVGGEDGEMVSETEIASETELANQDHTPMGFRRES